MMDTCPWCNSKWQHELERSPNPVRFPCGTTIDYGKNIERSNACLELSRALQRPNFDAIETLSRKLNWAMKKLINQDLPSLPSRSYRSS